MGRRTRASWPRCSPESYRTDVALAGPLAAPRLRLAVLGTLLVDRSRRALFGLILADAAVLVTEWPEFAELDWAAAAGRMARALLIDGRNFLDPNLLRSAGFEYEGIGRAVEGSVPTGTAE